MLSALAVMISMIIGSSSSFASDYRAVVTFPAGSQSDLIARAINEKLVEKTGHRLVIDNIPGAETVIGTVRWRDQKAPIIFTSSGQIITNQVLKSDLPYNDKDFNHVIYIGSSPAVWIVNNDSPIRNLDDLVKSKNLKVGGYASSYNENFHSVKKKFNLSATLVNYKGSPQIITDVASGHLESGLIPITPTLLSFVDQGKIRIIGSSFYKNLRVGNLNVPSISQVLKANTFTGFIGIALHPSLDPTESALLEKALWESLQSESVQHLLSTLYIQPDSSNDKDKIAERYQSLRNLVKNNQESSK